jgi:hypothetical protein
MLEVIHDLAPDAKLAFAAAPTKQSLLEALNWLVNAQHVDVVVSDVIDYTEPFFELGLVNGMIQSFLAAHPNLLFIQAAGNDGRAHVQARLQPIHFTNPALPAATQLLDPLAYRSLGDGPFANTVFSYFHLEDFEDGTFNTPGVAVSGTSSGVVRGPSPTTDSVDADDGKLDKSGLAGHSFGSSSGNATFNFVFDASVLGGLPTHVGVVLTDGANPAAVEAFDAEGQSLGSIPFNGFLGGPAVGQGAADEDRFIGFVHVGGIASIRASTTGSGGLELDHLQYGRVDTSGT